MGNLFQSSKKSSGSGPSGAIDSDFSTTSENALMNKSISNILAGVENGATASKVYVANDLILRNHNLYEVTVDVTSGTVWDVGTNLAVTTLAEQFAKINAELANLIRRGAMPNLNFTSPLKTFSTNASDSYTCTKDCYLMGNIEAISNYPSADIQINSTSLFKVTTDKAVASINCIKLSAGDIVSTVISSNVYVALNVLDIVS